MLCMLHIPQCSWIVSLMAIVDATVCHSCHHHHHRCFIEHLFPAGALRKLGLWLRFCFLQYEFSNHPSVSLTSPDYAAFSLVSAVFPRSICLKCRSVSSITRWAMWIHRRWGSAIVHPCMHSTGVAGGSGHLCGSSGAPSTSPTKTL